jgi:hypothetical protein
MRRSRRWLAGCRAGAARSVAQARSSFDARGYRRLHRCARRGRLRAARAAADRLTRTEDLRHAEARARAGRFAWARAGRIQWAKPATAFAAETPTQRCVRCRLWRGRAGHGGTRQRITSGRLRCNGLSVENDAPRLASKVGGRSALTCHSEHDGQGSGGKLASDFRRRARPPLACEGAAAGDKRRGREGACSWSRVITFGLAKGAVTRSRERRRQEPRPSPPPPRECSAPAQGSGRRAFDSAGVCLFACLFV